MRGIPPIPIPDSFTVWSPRCVCHTMNTCTSTGRTAEPCLLVTPCHLSRVGAGAPHLVHTADLLLAAVSVALWTGQDSHALLFEHSAQARTLCLTQACPAPAQHPPAGFRRNPEKEEGQTGTLTRCPESRPAARRLVVCSSTEVVRVGGRRGVCSASLSAR